MNGTNSNNIHNNNNGYHNSHTTDQSDDEYIDTIDDYETQSIHSESAVGQPQLQPQQQHASRTKVRSSLAPGDAVQQQQGSSSGSGRIVAQAMPEPYVDLRFHNVLSQLNMAVERINLDVQQVTARMVVVERTMNDVAKVGKTIYKQLIWLIFKFV